MESEVAARSFRSRCSGACTVNSGIRVERCGGGQHHLTNQKLAEAQNDGFRHGNHRRTGRIKPIDALIRQLHTAIQKSWTPIPGRCRALLRVSSGYTDGITVFSAIRRLHVRAPLPASLSAFDKTLLAP